MVAHHIGWYICPVHSSMICVTSVDVGIWNVALRYSKSVFGLTGHLFSTSLSHPFISTLCSRHWLPTRNLVRTCTTSVKIIVRNLADNSTFSPGTNWQLVSSQLGNSMLFGSGYCRVPENLPKRYWRYEFYFKLSSFNQQDLHRCIGAVCRAVTVTMTAVMKTNTAKTLSNIFLFYFACLLEMKWSLDWLNRVGKSVSM